VREYGASSIEKGMEIWGLIPQDNTAIHRRSGERGNLAFSREAATGGIRVIKMVGGGS
jgi:hypothetical protein